MKSKWHALCILSRGPAGLKDGHVGITDYVEGSTMCWNVNGVNEKKTLHVCDEDCTIRHSYRGRVQVCTASRFRAFLRYTDLQSGRWSDAFLSPLHTSQNTEQEFEKIRKVSWKFASGLMFKKKQHFLLSSEFYMSENYPGNTSHN